MEGDERGDIRLFLCGDVMTGRGVDQIMGQPSDPVLHEPHLTSAARYVELAEAAHGPLPRGVGPDYVWGEALEELERAGPDVRIVNLETAVTRSDDYWPGKEIHYRMHPENAGFLRAAGIDCCGLANNHVLDWGYAGLTETLETLKGLGVRHAGAGRDVREAEGPAVFDAGARGRVVVVACGSRTSGIPARWAAGPGRAGVHLVDEREADTVERIGALVRAVERPGDVVVVSIHWGGNWGYEIPAEQRALAHRLIDEAGVDVVHGHSSHHVKGVEVYAGRLVIYGAGDLLTDYEGIRGHEAYRGDLGLMYFPRLEADTGRLAALEMTPTQVRRFQLRRAAEADVEWLARTLTREGHGLGTRAERSDDGRLVLRWD